MSEDEAGRIRPRAYAYDPPGDGARVRPVWATVLILVLLVAGAMAAVVALMVATVAASAFSGRPPPPDLTQRWWFGVGLSLLLFLSWAGLAILWTRRGERRNLRSAGMPRAMHLDLRWWGLGALWSCCLVILLTAAGGSEFADAWPSGPIDFPWTRALLVIVVAALVVAVLAAVEEVVFRGWLLSALAARVGRRWALAGASVLFGAAHVFPPEWVDPARFLSFLGFAAMGVVFGCVALAQGRIWAAAAFHAGFNTVLVLLSAWSAGFDPQAMWNDVGGARSGLDDLRGAAVLAGAEVALAVLAVTLWLRGGQARLRFLSRPRSSSSAR